MTIHIAWWWIPIALALLAVAVPSMLRRQGDFDLGTPLIQLAIFAAFAMAAIGILIGKLLFQ